MRTYTPRPWPPIAKAARDGAAEEVAAALNKIVSLTDESDNAEEIRSIALAINCLQNALRHLESAGAQTRPALR
jgi:hypothetical protein